MRGGEYFDPVAQLTRLSPTGTCTQFLYIHGVFFNQFSYTQLAYFNKLSFSRVNMEFVTMRHIPKS